MSCPTKLRTLERAVENIRTHIEARTHRHRPIEIIDGGDHPWPGPEREPWDGTMPTAIVVIGVLPKEVGREH